MKINLYDYLMSMLNKVKHTDKIMIIGDGFSEEYDNIYQLLDRFHLMPDIKEYYKDYKVNGYYIVFRGSNSDTGRNICITIRK